MQPNSLFLRAVQLLGATLCATSMTLTSAQSAGNSELPASVRLALPGEQHRWLQPLVGRWNVEMRVFVPGQTPLVSKDMSARREWILGGRYLREELEGVFAGNRSTRIAVLSFNNLDERWELVTIDTFEPGQMWYASQATGTPARFALHGASTEAGMSAQPSGRKRDLRFEFEIVDANRNVQRIFVKYPAQPEYLFVEQTFTRIP